MGTEKSSSVRWPGWSSTLPFLMLAYPFTFLVYQGGRYCGALCFTPTPMGIAKLAAGLLVLLLAFSPSRDR